MKNEQLLILGAGAAVVVIVAGWYGAKKLAPKIDPASDQNVVYDNLIGGAGRAVSGDANWSLGGWIYDATHPAYDPNAQPSLWQKLTGW